MKRRFGLWCATATWVMVPSVAFAQTVPAGSATAQESTDSAAPGAQPQSPQEGTDEDSAGADIIVTANRREQRLQDVPISVTAVSGETLRERGVQNPEDLSRIAPSLVSQNNAANAKALQPVRCSLFNKLNIRSVR